MKRCFLIFAMVFVIASVCVAEVSQDPQKFEVIFTIKYNAMTMQGAADKEILLKKRCKDACEIKVEVKEASNGDFIFFRTSD